MKTLYAWLLIGCVLTNPAAAMLKQGDKAPDFTTQASLGGKEFTFTLSEALKSGPVVLYFYPAAFTRGCSIEARNFANATDTFKSYGATVIGISRDDIATLHRFAVADCQSKFAVGADDKRTIMKAYDSVMLGILPVSNRTSYVIAPTGEIIYAYSAFDPNGHVDNTLAAVKDWHGKQAAAGN